MEDGTYHITASHKRKAQSIDELYMGAFRNLPIDLPQITAIEFANILHALDEQSLKDGHSTLVIQDITYPPSDPSPFPKDKLQTLYDHCFPDSESSYLYSLEDIYGYFNLPPVRVA
jgi:hypothetical protein